VLIDDDPFFLLLKQAESCKTREAPPGIQTTEGDQLKEDLNAEIGERLGI